MEFQVGITLVGEDARIHLGAFPDKLSIKAFFGDGAERVGVDKICGPVEKLNDSPFVLAFYRMGLDNKLRTNYIRLLAHHDGDSTYHSAVQQLNIIFTYPLVAGKAQIITFPRLPYVKIGAKSLRLQAQSDSGLPVKF